MRTLGRPAAAPTRRAPRLPRRAEPPGPAIPAAERAPRPGWRDPRILLGLGLVAVCVLLGARIMASADDTVAVWSVRSDLAAGTVLDADDLQLTRVHFADGRALARYVAEDGLPEGEVAVTRDLATGELLPRAALGAGGEALVEVPLSVARGDLPGTVRAGSVVDVWLAPEEPSGKAARLLLDDVRVVALPAAADSLAPESTRQLVVGVPEDADDLADVLGRTGGGRIVVTQRSAAAVAP